MVKSVTTAKLQITKIWPKIFTTFSQKMVLKEPCKIERKVGVWNDWKFEEKRTEMRWCFWWYFFCFNLVHLW